MIFTRLGLDTATEQLRLLFTFNFIASPLSFFRDRVLEINVERIKILRWCKDKNPFYV